MLSSRNKKGDGYLAVVQPRLGEYHAKVTMDGGQVMLPGAACKTAQEVVGQCDEYLLWREDEIVERMRPRHRSLGGEQRRRQQRLQASARGALHRW